MESVVNVAVTVPSEEERRAEPEEPGVFDMVLRGQRRLDVLVSNEARIGETIERLLGLSVVGLAIHGACVGLVGVLVSSTSTAAVLLVPAAVVLAFLGALSICLPSFYFYTQLSGLDASFRLVTAQALRVQSTTAVLLLGALPFYAAIALGSGLGVGFDAAGVLRIGLALPFIVGLFGVREARTSFAELMAILPRTHARRGDFLSRLVLCWGAVYSVVAPVALYRLLEQIAPELLAAALGS